MQNFALLKAAGRAGRPVMLKRAMAATVEEWLLDKEDELARVADTVLAMAKDPAGSKAKAAKAREFVQQRQKAMCEQLAKTLTV